MGSQNETGLSGTFEEIFIDPLGFVGVHSFKGLMGALHRSRKVSCR